jgi:hypothetical protein
MKRKNGEEEDEEIKILSYRSEDANILLKNLNDSSYLALNNRKTSLRIFSKIFSEYDEQLAWLKDAKVHYNGRPLDFLEKERDKIGKEKAVRDLVKSYQYLFTEKDLLQIKHKEKELAQGWKEFPGIFKVKELEVLSLKVNYI